MNFYLDTLTDQELQRIVSDNIAHFLEPIKQNERAYMRYNAQLGTKKKDSPLVKANLPKIATTLYRKREQNFVKAMELAVDKLCMVFVQNAVYSLDRELTEEIIRAFSDADFAELINKYKEKVDSYIDFDILWVQLKLVGIEDIDARKDNILRLSGIEIDTDEIQESIDTDENLEVNQKQEETPKNVIKRPKAKKLTAEEKSAKARAANEAKEKAKVEELKRLIEENDGNDSNSEVESTKSIETENPNVEIDNSDKNGINMLVSESISDRNLKSKVEDAEVIRYIGVISIKTNYYNFTPIGLYQDNDYYSYSEDELDQLLPKSNKHNINFYYNFWDDTQAHFMEEIFKEGQLVLLDCEIDTLEENRTTDGSLNATGYKINAVDAWKNKKIAPLSAKGLYRVIQKEELIDEIESKRTIRISSDGFIEGEEVLVNFGEGFYGGPFLVKRTMQNNTYFIVLPSSDAKQCISGYNSTDCSKVFIEPSLDVEKWIGYNSWEYYVIKEGAVSSVRDFISDKELLESFKESLDRIGNIDYSNFDANAVLKGINDSSIISDNIPDDIKNKRVERIYKILSNREELMKVFSDASDLVYNLLFSNKDNMQIDALISEMLIKKPELLDNVQGIRAIEAKVEAKKEELAMLEHKYADIYNSIESGISSTEKADSRKDANEVLDEELVQKKIELETVLSKLEDVDDLLDLQNKREKLQEEVDYFEKHKAHLVNDAKNLESNFVELINGYSERIADITFDGFMSSKMLQAAAEWDGKRENDGLLKLVTNLNNVEIQEMSQKELINYVVDTVQIARPGYSKNTILNIITCAAQGFLTVFSGTPGCGKTSICNIVSRVLGLSNYGNLSPELKDVKRYISVSVERGWTSKRDFIGYFNPLTKAFEESNRDVFDGLKLLDIEHQQSINKWPFYILLDEANLSPMEYYWADFMNVCDDLTDNSLINLGNDNVFRIPETLHFLATINNDHTTEVLSPRLIDRAWIITLPKAVVMQESKEIPADKIMSISWSEIKNAFVISGGEKISFDRETKSVYEGIKDLLERQDISISPRIDIAIQKYWAVAAKIMEEDEYGNTPSAVALDYAVAQKILPKIAGSGDEYEEWLNELEAYCNKKGLIHSASIIKSIIERGNRQMKYYQFF